MVSSTMCFNIILICFYFSTNFMLLSTSFIFFSAQLNVCYYYYCILSSITFVHFPLVYFLLLVGFKTFKIFSVTLHSFITDLSSNFDLPLG